jgi:hypothetical protein
MANPDYFNGLQNDMSFGKYHVPSPDQYDARIAELQDTGLPLSAIAIEAQRDWHTRGQNGCNFARIAARRAMEVGWHSEFIGLDNVERAGEVMETAVNDPDRQIVSLVFDRMSASDLVDTIVTLTETSEFYLEKDEVIDDGSRRQLFLRYPLAAGRIAAWSMCFAPHAFMPNTRRSPFTEIATRVKEKPEGLHPMLNGNPAEAHLADLIVDANPKHTADRTHPTEPFLNRCNQNT